MLEKTKAYLVSEIINEAGLPVYIQMGGWTPDFFVCIDNIEDNIVSGYGINWAGMLAKRYCYPSDSKAFYRDLHFVEETIAEWKEYYKKETYEHWKRNYSLTDLAPCSFHYYQDKNTPKYIPGKTILTVKRNGEYVNAVFTGFDNKNDRILTYTYYENSNKFCFLENTSLKYLNGTEAQETEIRDLVKEIECCTENCEVILHYLRDMRNVKYLVHFTPVDNLMSIFCDGILPRKTLETERKGIFTDDIRYDNCKECSCFSLSFPNYQMLFRKRLSLRSTTFAVLMVDINALTSSEVNHVYYLPVNASSREFSNYVREFSHLKDAENLFADKLFYRNQEYFREQLNIPANFTTSPQAEVLIDGVISPSYIKEIHFPVSCSNGKQVFPLKDIPPHISYKISDEFFRPRVDSDFWLKGEKDDGEETCF